MRIKKGRAIGIIASIIVALLACIVFMVKNKQNSTATLDIETLRSQSYEEINESDMVSELYSDVKFGAFFERDIDGDGYNEHILGSCRSLSSSDTLLLELNVGGNGTLKKGYITVSGSNFNYKMTSPKDSVLKYDYVSNNVSRIELNDIDSGTQRLLMGNTISNVGNQDEYSGIATISLYGIYVPDGEVLDENQEPQLIKSYNLTIDWYGSATAKFTNISRKEYNYSSQNINKTLEFSFTLERYEKKNALIVKSQKINVKIPSLKNKYPVSVTCNNGDWNYNEESHILEITNQKYSNSASYRVTLEYPDEVYEEIIKDNTDGVVDYVYPEVSGYLECYNNPNEGFKNPYITSVVKASPVIQIGHTGQTVAAYSTQVKFENLKEYSSHYNEDVVSKQRILDAYDSVEKIDNIQYRVRWVINRNKSDINETTLNIKDKGDYFGGLFTPKNIGIYFYSTTLIPNTGTITIYNDETNEVVKEFKDGEWNQYTYKNPFYYNEGIKKIRIETSESTKDKNSFSVVNLKEINVEEIKQNFSRAQIENADYVNTTATFSGSNITNMYTNYDSAKLVCLRSHGEISISSDRISTSETDLVKRAIRINIPSSNVTYGAWKNGVYLVEIPEEITAMTLDAVSATKVDIDSSILYKENGKYYIKIITSNGTKTSGYTITINCKMQANPTCSTKMVPIKLYMYNEALNMYYSSKEDSYDIDGDGNKSEIIGYNSTDMQITSVDGFVTAEILSEYNDKKETIYSSSTDLAEIDTSRRQATITVFFANNYQYKSSNIKVLGKIPFEGNTYVEGGTLYSTFSTKMTNDGIKLLDGLENKATIYYSEKENPTKDLDNDANGWMLSNEVQDFSRIKTYLVVINDDVSRGQFSYNVTIPEGVKLNQKAFSCHMIYYDLSINGALSSFSVQPRKLGMVIAKYYGIEANKYKHNTTHPVEGALYAITECDEEGKETNKIVKTGADGIVKYENLRINQEYTFKEVQAPSNYKLNKKNIVFKVIENEETKELEFVQVSEDTFDGNIKLEKNDIGDYILKTYVFDTPKYVLNITKVDSADNSKLEKVAYTIDANLCITDEEGRATTKNLELNRQYTLSETYADGYYLKDITFSIDMDKQGNLCVISEDPEMKNAQIVNDANVDLAQVSVTISNEKIPTFNLQILKVEENNKEEDFTKLKPLQGAEFIFYNEDTNSEKVYTTDDNGNINIPNLYQYVDGKYLKASYMIKEQRAPTGYENNAEEIFFRVQTDENDIIKVNVQDQENKSTIRDILVDGENIKIIVQDRPLFRITKIDKKTKQPLANVGFIISEIITGSSMDYAKDVNGNYVGELNEKGQYIVRTDENGVITLPLRNGKYEMVEVEFPEGYDQNVEPEFFEVKTDVRANNQEEKPEEDEPEEDIIQITTIPELIKFADSVNSGNTYNGKIIELMNNLDFKEDNYDEALKATLTTGDGFTPIGTESNCFSGTFRGNGFEIRNIHISSSENAYVGLFGYVNGGTIRNIGVTGDVVNNMDSTSSYAGGVIGFAKDTDIINCYNKCSVSCNGYAGGIAGFSNANKTTGCYNAGEISGKYYAGGILGLTPANTINRCFNKGKITSECGIAGGISGCGGTITNCYNTNNVTSTNSQAGGIVGVNGVVTYCYNIGNVVSENGPAGGISGTGSTVSNSYYLQTINISGSQINASGTKMTDANMKNKSFISNLGSDNWAFGGENINGGYPYPVLYGLFTDNNVEEIGTAEELMQFAKNVNSGNSYAGKTIKLTDDIYLPDDLKSTIGKDKEIVEINSIEKLVELSTRVNNGNSYEGKIVVLTKDLDFENDDYNATLKANLTNKSGSGFTPIGTSNNKFKGVFDGQGHTINNIYINRTVSSCAGLFGYIEDGLVCNLGITGEITGKSYTGGIVGEARKTSIINCHNSAAINSSGDAGGIVGYILSSGCYVGKCYNNGVVTGSDTGGIAGSAHSGVTIDKCYNTAKITGSFYTGGIVGSGYEVFIKNSYNTGNVTGIRDAGGIVGSLWGEPFGIINCYNTGNVASSADYPAGHIAGAISSYKASHMQNCYYIDSISVTGKKVNQYNSMSISMDDMKSESFVTQLQSEFWIADTDNNNNGFPIIKDDSSYEDAIIQQFKGIGFIPIGTENNPFAGTFDGQGHTIKNLYIKTAERDAGLFGYAKYARFNNLIVEGTIEKRGPGTIGGIVGFLKDNDVKIEGCKFTGELLGNGENTNEANVGGIVGYLEKDPESVSVISDCTSSANINLSKNSRRNSWLCLWNKFCQTCNYKDNEL